MRLKYTGPKSLISPTGINFYSAKEDKFVFIGAMIELIRVLDHDYEDSKAYSVQTEQKSFDEKSVIDLIRTYVPDLDEQINQWINKTVQAIDEELLRAKNNLSLSHEAKEVIINNIELMRSYRLQRTINKSVYYAGIEALAALIKQRRIYHVTTSMNPKFFHVLHSVQGSLRHQHPILDSEIDLFEEKGHLMAKLRILGV